MSNERDTHFQGFAKLLIQEIDEQVGAVTKWGLEHDIDSPEKIGQELYSRWQTVIAQRTYDLIVHTLNIVPHLMQVEARTAQEVIPYIPNMTAWPE